jgi:protein-ribulosamine 3-kinase
VITSCPTPAEALCAYYGSQIQIVSSATVSGGCINQASKLTLSNGEQVFQKENSSTFDNMFFAEAAGLDALRGKGGPQVPEPIAVHQGERTQFILMSFIRQSDRRADFWEAFGRAFATLHRYDATNIFGFESDNFIGSTVQKNTKSKSWIEFYGRHRLGFQIDLARKKGLASPKLVQKCETLISRLADFLPDDPHPSTLHGDLWGGNVMTGDDGNAAIIDPAAYYGQNEADLAMTELFGRFPDSFYDAYDEILPLDPEYKTRKDIYALYHVLNHLNLFGTSYAGQAMSMLNRFV